jgi:hypothetical protein
VNELSGGKQNQERREGSYYTTTKRKLKELKELKERVIFIVFQ